jgi:hypothetical protein
MIGIIVADGTLKESDSGKLQAGDAKQSFETAGIAPMERPSRVTRFFMSIVSWAEGLNLKYAKYGNPPVYDNATFPWSSEIEKAWPEIRKELDHVLLRQSELPAFQDISTDVKNHLDGQELEDVLSDWFRRQIGAEHSGLPEYMGGRAENSKSENSHVFDFRTGQTSAASPRTV